MIHLNLYVRLYTMNGIGLKRKTMYWYSYGNDKARKMKSIKIYYNIISYLCGELEGPNFRDIKLGMLLKYAKHRNFNKNKLFELFIYEC